MTDPGWYYREEIEYELDRLEATTWRYQEQSGEFVIELEAASGDVELRSEVCGARPEPAHGSPRRCFGPPDQDG